MAWLHLVDVYKKGIDNYTVKNISFTQDTFQNLAIAGETGSGKSTLLKMIAGLVQPDSGEIFFRGVKVLGPDEKLIPGHEGIAYLSQHFELRNNYRVGEELEAVNQLSDNLATAIYEICRITHLLNRKTTALSGGERQRVVLAKQLVTSPKLLLLDEPYSNLDGIHKNITRSVIRDISDKLNITCIMVLHDAPDLLSWADRVLVLKDGEMIQEGSPQQIYYQPVNEYCAALFGDYTLLNPQHPAIDITTGHFIDGKLLCRPEQFSIEMSAEGNAVVDEILFAGSYYTIVLQSENELIRARTTHHTLDKGDRVNLRIIPGQI